MVPINFDNFVFSLYKIKIPLFISEHNEHNQILALFFK